jgi:hopene-associated glycosyltransferase HpnB
MALALGLLCLAVWIYLLGFHKGFWKADQRLPTVEPPARWPGVTAIVPARNEAASIARCVEALATQDYPGSLSIIVVDDGSTDGTGEIARTAAAGAGHPVDVISGREPPPEWSGKLWALQAGLDTSADRAAEATHVWFTDADIVHGSGTLSKLVALSCRRDLDLVSLMARLHCTHCWERLLIPAFIFFFQMLYPFPAVNDPASRIAGAAGGCVLLRRDALGRIGGLNALRGALIDDCAIAAAVKGSGGRLWLGLASDTVSLRESRHLAELWGMVARTAFTQLRYSALLLAGTVAGLGITFLLPPLLVLSWPLHQDLGAGLCGALSWAIMAMCYAPTVKDYGRPALEAIALPVTAALYGAMTVHSAVNHWRGATSHWKGRAYQKSHTSPIGD